MASDKAQIDAIQRELRGVTSTAVKTTAGAVMNAAIEATPVATGLTQANWQAKRGEPVTSPVGDRSPSGVATARAAQDASRPEIAGWRRGTLHVGNAEGNAERLNDGNVSGRESSAGFVQRAIRKGISAGEVAATARARAAGRRGGAGR